MAGFLPLAFFSSSRRVRRESPRRQVHDANRGSVKIASLAVPGFAPASALCFHRVPVRTVLALDLQESWSTHKSPAMAVRQGEPE
jgi:hypothetical protein